MDTVRLIALMVVGTLLGLTLCFLNKIFKKPYLYIRNMAFCAIIGLFTALYLGGTVFKDLPQWITGFSFIVLPTLFGSLSTFLGLIDQKTHEIVSMGLTGPVVFFLVTHFSNLSVVSSLCIGLGTSASLVALGFFVRKQYFTLECSLCGAWLLAALYSNCFYLEDNIFWVLFTALSLTGFILGLVLKDDFFEFNFKNKEK